MTQTRVFGEARPLDLFAPTAREFNRCGPRISLWARIIAAAAIACFAMPAHARMYGVATQIANPPSTLFEIDTDLNAPPFSDTWTSYVLGVKTDDGSIIGALDVNLTGHFLQRWAIDNGTSVPTGGGTNLTSGDSHLIPGNIPLFTPAENNNTPTSLPFPSDSATRDYGVGTTLTGVWAYDSISRAAQIPGEPVNFGYIVIPKGSESTLGIRVATATALGVTQTLTNADFGDAFCLGGSCGAARLEVYSDGKLVADGRDASFGSVNQTTLQERTFTIKNTGLSTLKLEQPSLTGPFALVGSFPTTIQMGADASFKLGLNTSTPGVLSGSISFGNNSPINNPYNFALLATVQPVLPLGIQVLGNGQVIQDGDVLPNALNNTHFGRVLQNSVQQRTFILRNETATPISLSTPTLSGPFSLVGTFPSSVAPLSDVPFTVNLDTSTLGTYYEPISFENGDSQRSPYNFYLGAKVEEQSPPGATSVLPVITKIEDPASGINFNAPEAALPPGWVAYQISLQTTNGELIGAVDVTIDGPLHQRWTDSDFDGITEPSPNGRISNGRGDSHLTAPANSVFGYGPEEFNLKTGSPLPSIPGNTEYGLGGLAGAWTISSPATFANVAYIVFRADQLSQLQFTIKSANTQGVAFRTLTNQDLFVFQIPEPSTSALFMIASISMSATIRRRFSTNIRIRNE